MSDLSDILLSADYATAPWFAVLDGAQFDNLPDALREGKFVARSLYLDRGENNPEQVITAPHLVVLDETAHNPALRPPAETVPALLDLIKDSPAAVFWKCPAGQEALFKHLRGINMVRLPRTEPGSDEDTHETVLFRHADANALVQVAAVLHPPQIARLLGPAETAILFPEPEWRDGEGLVDIGRVDAIPPIGLLTLDATQRDRIADGRAESTIRRTKGYLRRHLPPPLSEMPEADLDMVARRSRKSGAALGIRSAGGHRRWAYLMAVTEGRAADDPQVRAFLTDPASRPDDQVRLAMRETIAAMKAAAEELH
ncbi:DUF4123 domain-containing protein [Aestuariibius insulae]|uniref:DUF4123 domain-containing protein n=1 Tax=Aestuariibius insulae TaxID=2058287 RepID=UPI00345E2658